MRYKFLILDTYNTDTLYLRKQGCGVRWVFFERKRGRREKKFGETVVYIILKLQHVSALAFMLTSLCDCWDYVITVL
jgi:hypothetical protein